MDGKHFCFGLMGVYLRRPINNSNAYNCAAYFLIN